MMTSHLLSSYDALKQLFAIMVGVAIANVSVTIGKILSGVSEIGGRGHPGFDDPSPMMSSLIGLLLVMLCIRFYHGNVRSIDEEIISRESIDKETIEIVTDGDIDSAEGKKPEPLQSRNGPRSPLHVIIGLAGFQSIELATVILQGGLLTSIGILLTRAHLLWTGLWILYLSDFLLVTAGFLASGMVPRYRRIWLFINGSSVVILGAQYLFYLPFTKAILLVLSIGFLLDYLINWNFYFPTRAHT